MNRVGNDPIGKKLAGNQDGSALVIVLYALVFMSLLGTSLVVAGRQTTQRARNLVDNAVAEAAADGAVHQAIYALLDPFGPQWELDGRAHMLRYGQLIVEVRVQDEGDKVNPNFAPIELMQALLARLDVSPLAATNLAAAIADWRMARTQPVTVNGRTPENLDAKAGQESLVGRDYVQSGMVFGNIDDLGAMPGMTSELLARLEPHLTLYSDSDPDASSTDPVVAAAIGGDTGRTGRPNMADGPRAVSISAVVHGPRCAGLTERVVVRTNALNGIRRYEILSRATNSPQG